MGLFKPSTTRVATALIVIFSCLILYQNCAQYMGSKLVKADAGSTDDTTEPPDPTAYSVPLPTYGRAQAINAGDFTTLTAGKDLNLNIGGRAVMVRTLDGQTRVDVIAFGLPVSSLVMAHVHVLPCAQGAGGHYKLNPSDPATRKSNELWPMLFTDANGVGFGTVTVDSIVTDEAKSVVIHSGPSNAKVACADLAPPPAAAVAVEAGDFAVVGTGPAGIVGRAMLVRKDNGQTVVRTAVAGLTASTMYASHLHDLDCAAASGHYKIDTTIADALETNEIWPAIATNAAGVGFGFKSVNHTVRAGAHSVVIHNPVGGARMACANLTAGGGGFLPLEAGLTRNRRVAGSAVMNRQLNGGTTFTVQVRGLAPSTTYMAHVHNRSCASGGGAHYKVDESVTTAIMDNEVWLNLSTDATGAATSVVTAPHIVRPDAASIVIHDVGDSAKLACADLY